MFNKSKRKLEERSGKGETERPRETKRKNLQPFFKSPIQTESDSVVGEKGISRVVKATTMAEGNPVRYETEKSGIGERETKRSSKSDREISRVEKTDRGDLGSFQNEAVSEEEVDYCENSETEFTYDLGQTSETIEDSLVDGESIVSRDFGINEKNEDGGNSERQSTSVSDQVSNEQAIPTRDELFQEVQYLKSVKRHYEDLLSRSGKKWQYEDPEAEILQEAEALELPPAEVNQEKLNGTYEENHQRWITQLGLKMLTKQELNYRDIKEWNNAMKKALDANPSLIRAKDVRDHIEKRVMEWLDLKTKKQVSQEKNPYTLLKLIRALYEEDQSYKPIFALLKPKMVTLKQKIDGKTRKDDLPLGEFYIEVKTIMDRTDIKCPSKKEMIIFICEEMARGGTTKVVLHLMQTEGKRTLEEWQDQGDFDAFWSEVTEKFQVLMKADNLSEYKRKQNAMGSGREKSTRSYSVENEDSDSNNHPEHQRKKQKIQKAKQEAPTAKGKFTQVTCMVCGRGHHNECKLKYHPQANKEGIPWAESRMGKLYKREGINVLPFEKQIVDGKLIPWDKNKKCKSLMHKAPDGCTTCGTSTSGILSEEELESSRVRGSSHSGQYSENCTAPLAQAGHDDKTIQLLSLKGLINSEDGSIKAELLPRNTTKSTNDAKCLCVVLMDTGANPYNFCNHRMRDLSIKYGSESEECSHRIQTGQYITQVKQKITLSIRLCNINKVDFEVITLECLVIPMIHDVVIGRKTIQKHSVLRQKLCKDYLQMKDLQAIQEKLSSETTQSSMMRSPDPIQATSDREIINPTLSRHEEQYSVVTPYLANMYSKSQELELPTVIQGDEAFRHAQLRLCEEFADCFSGKLRPEAALIPPMELRVSDAWDCKENKRSPRPQGKVRQQAIDEQITDMEMNGVIRLSSADNHSQIHLQPKPDGSWRFCVDYRRLNQTTVGQSWPIPNIKEMLRRIGDARPRWFGVLDLTKGYYQAPLSEGCRKYTAFITAKHLWEWCRVPMGLMGAPAYFQKMMTTVVLGNIIRQGCECYMDDIIVYGADKETYLANLTRVFKQLRKYKLTASPKKTRLGLQQIEYVGHVIDHDGITFDRNRLQKIIEFPLPETQKELKSFLGLANYVRDNCDDVSGHTRLLNAMIHGYNKRTKNQKVPWTDESRAAFTSVQKMVNNAQKLFFIRDDATSIHLYTDASQYGIGASLVQVVDGKEQVVSLMSRTLNKTQCNWSTIEKECFAIVEAFRKFEYLIRDVHFILHTDHANLVHIKDTGSPKVIAWKMMIQEFDFECEYIQGPKNGIADVLSRNTKAEVLEEEAEPYIVTDIEAITRDVDGSTTPKRVRDPMLMAAQCIDSQVRPNEDQYKLIKSVHNPVVGHNGVETTIKRLKDKGHQWKYMRPMVTRFIKQCDTCQKNDARRQAVHVQPFITLTGTGLMKERSVDFIGPLEEDSDGNRYICVVIDQFSRWVELYRTKNNDAMAAAKALLDHFGRFGIPTNIRTDQGREFRNELIENFMKLVGCEHTFSTADSHEENGIVEAANAEVRRYLNEYAYDRQLGRDTWSDNLPIAQRIINSMDKSLTGMTPAHILFGGGLDLQDGLISKAADTTKVGSEMENISWAKWLESRQAATARATRIIRHRLEEHERIQRERDSGLRTEYAVGSMVLKEYRPSAMGRKPNKQTLYRTGPYEVVAYEGQTYTLKDPVNGKRLPPCNIHLLRAYEYDPMHTDPQRMRTKDFEDVFLIDEVLRHVGKWSDLKNMKFIVKWVGYDEEYEETWNNLKNNVMLHKYLEEQNMKKYIPKIFRKTKLH